MKVSILFVFCLRDSHNEIYFITTCITQSGVIHVHFIFYPCFLHVVVILLTDVKLRVKYEYEENTEVLAANVHSARRQEIARRLDRFAQAFTILKGMYLMLAEFML